MKNIFAVLAAIFCGACSTAPAVVPENAVLLDVRSETEFAAGHIPGSILIPHDQISRETIKKLPAKDAPIVIFCRSGRRSAIAKAALQKLGFTDLTDLGGIENAAKVLKKTIVKKQ